MKFPAAVVLAVVASAVAQGTTATTAVSSAVSGSPSGSASSGANPFNVPTSGITASAGKTTTLNWKPTTSGTVSLILRSGASNALDAGVPIAKDIPNSGSYTWNVDSSITRGSDYTIEIVSSGGVSNYSPYFVIDSPNTVASVTNSGSSASVTVASTGSASGSSSGSASVTATSASTHASGSSTATSHDTSSATGASSTSAGFQGASSTSASHGAAARATAAAGVLGLVALGAIAL